MGHVTVSPDQARMLTALALDCRPTGAPRWDAAGVMAAIKRVAHLALADVTHAVIRAAEDRDARTPAVITATNSLHWQDRNPDRPALIERATAVEHCHICGKTFLRHTATDHEFESLGQFLARRQPPDPDRHLAAELKQLASCETVPEESDV